MEIPAFIGASLSDVKVIMMIMCVLVVELLCQTVTGRIPVLECLLLGTRGRLRLCLIMFGIKWPHHSRTLALEPLARYLGYPQVWLQRHGHISSRGARISQTGLTVGKILPARRH
jgi:hypothetical protein